MEYEQTEYDTRTDCENKNNLEKDSKTKAKPMSVNLHSIISHWIGNDSGGSRGWALGTEGGGGEGAPPLM